MTGRRITPSSPTFPPFGTFVGATVGVGVTLFVGVFVGTGVGDMLPAGVGDALPDGFGASVGSGDGVGKTMTTGGRSFSPAFIVGVGFTSCVGFNEGVTEGVTVPVTASPVTVGVTLAVSPVSTGADVGAPVAPVGTFDVAVGEGLPCDPILEGDFRLPKV